MTVECGIGPSSPTAEPAAGPERDESTPAWEKTHLAHGLITIVDVTVLLIGPVCGPLGQ